MADESLSDKFFAALQAAATQQQGFKNAAPLLLPALRDSIANGTLDDKASNAPAMYSWLMHETTFAEFSSKLTSVTPADISGFIGKAISAATPEKRAADLKANTSSMTEAEHIRYAKAMESALPPGMAAAITTARGNQTLEQEVLGTRDMVQNLTLPELTQAFVKYAPKTEAVAEGLYQLLQQATPNRLNKLQEYIAENFEGASLGLLIKRGWLFAEALLTAAENGNFLDVNPAKGRAFARSLQETLSVIEDGLEAAGFKVPDGLGSQLIAVMDPANALHGALAEREAKVALMGSTRSFTVRRSPVKMKPPQQP